MVMRLPLEDLWRGRASLRGFTASPRTLWCSESLQRASLWHSSILPPPPPGGPLYGLAASSWRTTVEGEPLYGFLFLEDLSVV